MVQMADLSLEGLQRSVHLALTAWGSLASSDEELLSHLLLVKEERAHLAGEMTPSASRQATNNVLLDAVNELANEEEKQAIVIEARFLDGEIIRQVAQRLHASVDQVNRWQRLGIENLARIIYSREHLLREQRIQLQETGLEPPTYDELFGFEPTIRLLEETVLKPGAGRVTAITGIGGIGKTSLAHALTLRLIRTFAFERVIWLNARGRAGDGSEMTPEARFERLLADLAELLWPEETISQYSIELYERARQELRKDPSLTVIDNLETVEDTAYTLDKIRAFPDHAKFLVTTRARPPGQTSVYFFQLAELSLEEATALLKHHAAAIGLAELTSAPDDLAREMYELTGGNPLAIKLVVSLAAVLPLGQILVDLARSRPGPVEGLYRHIYWESWRTLSEPARSLLQAMPLVAETGALPDQMQAISGLSDDTLWPAIGELVSRSLLEVRGSVRERRYGIHRLTESFLRTEIIHWPDV